MERSETVYAAKALVTSDRQDYSPIAKHERRINIDLFLGDLATKMHRFYIELWMNKLANIGMNMVAIKYIYYQMVMINLNILYGI